MTLTVGSLFSGIGGLDLGLARAGFRTLWMVECDDYARKVLRRRFPAARLWVDVHTARPGPLERPDVLAGGFPCQDVSQAGTRTGLEGARSGLWREFARCIRLFRPRYVLVENVPALRVRGLGRVLGDLAGLGYDAEWECIPAALFGAPHVRNRLWLVAYADGGGREVLRLPQPVRVECQPGRFPDRRGVVWQLPNVAGGGHGWAAEPDVGRVADGVSRRVDRLRVLGNAVVPAVAEYLGRLILQHAEAAHA
jgi:DNA (cytosine-5)-methyltransferase 1